MSQRFTPDSRPLGEPAETAAIGRSESLVDADTDPAAPQPIDPAALAEAQNTAPPAALLAIVGALFREAEYYADHVRRGLLDHPYPDPRDRRGPFPHSGRTE